MSDVTQANYRSLENEAKYMTSSQFRSFKKCSASALAQYRAKQAGAFITEDWYPHPVIEAFRMGRAVEALVAGGEVMLREEFKGDEHLFFKKITKKAREDHQKHKEAILSLTGEIEAKGNTKKMYERILEEKGNVLPELKSEPSKLLTEARRYAEAIAKYFKGIDYTHSRILTGVIGGIDYKAEYDFDDNGSVIWDTKVVADVDKEYYRKENNKHIWETFEYRNGYHIQASIYQELWRQNFEGNPPNPQILAIEKSEDAPVLPLEFSQRRLEHTLEDVINRSEGFAYLKVSDPWIEGIRCNDYKNCRYCRRTRMVDISKPILRDPEGWD